MIERRESGSHPSNERTATLLGEVGRGLDGAVSRADDLAARERFLVSLGTHGKRPTRSVLLAALVLALALGAAALVVFRASSGGVEYEVTGPAIARGEWLDAPPDLGAIGLHFSEGTEMELGPGSNGRVADATAKGARVVLGEGALHARVVHRPDARWSVAAGPYEVEVTGTVFDVKWSAATQRLEVSLHDGSVLVHGPSLERGIRVVAGQRLEVGESGPRLSSLFEADAKRAATAAIAPAVEPSSAVPPAPAKEAPAEEAPARTWSDLVSVGNFRAVLDAATARGIDQTVSHGSLRDLVALSDAARYAGDRPLARRGLLAQRSRFGASAEAHAAAFVLGRMADDGGSPREALEWYDGYLREAPHGAFAAEALGRRLVALVRLGETQAARDAAGTYLSRFPRGAHAAYARELLRSP